MAKKQVKKSEKKKDKHPEMFERIEVKHEFTETEMVVILHDLTRALRETESITEQSKSSAKSWKVKIEQSELKVGELTNKAQDGFEMRPIEARVEFDRKRGKKTYFDKDSGETLSEADMTSADYERLPMDIQAVPPGDKIVSVADAFEAAEKTDEPAEPENQ